ncbi:MAG: hypothetical protein DHS20C11_08310 [Lysobacteraceae bacterium]|nr:MAG: hypothetical protein DHS20C11_08310 [Xanthomonadaceae bacterium]
MAMQLARYAQPMYESIRISYDKDGKEMLFAIRQQANTLGDSGGQGITGIGNHPQTTLQARPYGPAKHRNKLSRWT